MEAQEVKRRERAAIQDIGGTALYHANRLPLESRWRRPICRVAEALGYHPDPPRDRPRLTLVGGEG